MKKTEAQRQSFPGLGSQGWTPSMGSVSSCPYKREVSLTPVALCICYPTTMLSLNAATEITVLLGMVAHACYPALRRPGLEDSPGLQSEILLRRGEREKGIALYLVFLCVSPTRL